MRLARIAKLVPVVAVSAVVGVGGLLYGYSLGRDFDLNLFLRDIANGALGRFAAPVTAMAETEEERFARPAYAWLPSVAPSSLTLVHGFHEAWDGDLLVGSLRGTSLHRIRIAGERVVFVERIRREIE